MHEPTRTPIDPTPRRRWPLPGFSLCFVCALVAGALVIAALAQFHTLSA